MATASVKMLIRAGEAVVAGRATQASCNSGADVVGYSRLMAADESGTLARLRQLRAEVFEPKFAQLHGRIVGSAGDSLLVEFASAVEEPDLTTRKALAFFDYLPCYRDYVDCLRQAGLPE